MKVKGADGQTRLYSFGGCHRYEAHKRLEKDTIKAKLLETPPVRLLMCFLQGSKGGADLMSRAERIEAVFGRRGHGDVEYKDSVK